MLIFKLRPSTTPTTPPFTTQCQPFQSTFPAITSTTSYLRARAKKTTLPDKMLSSQRWPVLRMSICHMVHQTNAWISITLIACHSLTMATRSSNVIKCQVQLATPLRRCSWLSPGRCLTLEWRVRLNIIYSQISNGSKIVLVEIMLPRTLNIIQTSSSPMETRILGSQPASRSTCILNCLSST